MNVDIYVAYAEANGIATEALGNIRTVKAMSTEVQGEIKFNILSRLIQSKQNYVQVFVQGRNAIYIFFLGRRVFARLRPNRTAIKERKMHGRSQPSFFCGSLQCYTSP